MCAYVLILLTVTQNQINGHSLTLLERKVLDQPGLRSQHYHIVAVWVWISHLGSISLSFLTYKMGITFDELILVYVKEQAPWILVESIVLVLGAMEDPTTLDRECTLRKMCFMSISLGSVQARPREPDAWCSAGGEQAPLPWVQRWMLSRELKLLSHHGLFWPRGAQKEVTAPPWPFPL